MDELLLVRDFFGDPAPPDPIVVAAAKARLAAGEPPAARPRARWPRGRLARFGLPAVAVAVAAAIVAAVLVQGPAPARRPAAPAGSRQAGGLAIFQLPAGAVVGGTAGSEQDVLLMAARTAASAPLSRPARYYVTPGLVGNFMRVGPAGNRYTVLEVVDRQYWAATNPRDGSPDMSQALYVRLASPADEAAWRRDGSPRVWKSTGQEAALATPTGTSEGWLLPLSAARGKLTAMTAAYGSQPFNVGSKALSLRQLRALPADPARLKTLLSAGWSPAWGLGSATSYLFQTVPAVLEMPVTPAVRAALYRLLAGLPGVRSLGTVTDVAGQQGVAVAHTEKYTGCGRQIGLTSTETTSGAMFSWCTVQQILIIGPGDGMPLAEELRYTQLPPGQHWSAPDGLFSYEVFGTPYWTGRDRPNRPSS